MTENHRDYNVRKSLKCSKRASQVENVLSVIFMYNTPYSSAMNNFLSIDFRIYLTTRLCRSRPVGRNTCSAYCCVTHHIYLVKTRTTVEALLTDTLVSGQLYLWTLFSIPLFDLFPLFLMEIIPVSGQLH